MILWILFSCFFAGSVLILIVVKGSYAKKTFRLTCVSHGGDVGTLKIQAETIDDAIKEANTYPAVSYVIDWEELTDDTEI